MMAADLISFSKPAIQHICQILARHDNDKCFYLTLKETGCSGYMYKPSIVDPSKIQDEIKIVVSAELTVYIDQKAVDLIRGTEVDYVKKNLGEQLVFMNPRAKSECGCGESFSM